MNQILLKINISIFFLLFVLSCQDSTSASVPRNLIDEDTMEKIGKSPFVLVVESLNSRTGLGVRFGTWLLERGFTPNYDYMGTTRPGNCGQEEQILHQGLGVDGLKEKLSSFL